MADSVAERSFRCGTPQRCRCSFDGDPDFAILAVLIDFLASVALIPPALRGTNWEVTIRVVAGAIVLVAQAIMIIRHVQRASIRGTPVLLSRLREHSRDRNGAALEPNGELGLFGRTSTVDQAPRPLDVA